MQDDVAVRVQDDEAVEDVRRTAGSAASAALAPGRYRSAATCAASSATTLATATALAATSGRDPLEALLAIVVPDASRVVLVERDADAALEASGGAARHGVPVLPADDLHAFSEDLFNRV